MARRKNDNLQGTLEMVILQTLARGPAHGYGVVCHVRDVTEGVLRVEDGSLYPALQRMELRGWVTSEWRLSETNRRARFYSLTAEGRKQLAKEAENWEQVSRAIRAIMSFA